MVKKGFPKFGITQSGAFVAALKNYNLPDFILALVAKECDSDLLERGRIDDRLSSLNDTALEFLHKIFVDCEEDQEGKYAQYRFFSYVSSMYHKCEVLISEVIPGKSGKNHKIPIAVKNNGMYIAVGFNKPTGHPVSKRDIIRFYEIQLEKGTIREGGAAYKRKLEFKDKLEEKLKTRKQQLNDRINEIEKTDKDLITLLQKLSETDEKLF